MGEQPADQTRRLAALDQLEKESRGVRADPSSLRLYIRDNFASVAAARRRGVSWPQIAGVLADAGVRAPDGSPLTWRKVAVLFHTERYERDPKRKRQRKRPKAAAPAAAPPSPPPQPSGPRPPQATEVPAKPQPVPANPANPWAEVDRQTAEAKARREEAERSKDWNPYATPKEKPE